MAESRAPEAPEAPATAVSRKRSSQSDRSARPHFRIDWRQLTYYPKSPRSFLEELAPARWSRRAGPLKPDDERAEAALRPDGSEEFAATRGAAGQRAILNSLDGCFKSGELSAILGPSGAGKSTFLSALFGNKQEASFGQTRVTWLADSQAELMVDKRRTIRIASLPQHDHLLNHLSVYETLMFASKIKNPRQPNDGPFHRANVRRVAKMLKLTDCFGTRCGRLSGGQHKRVSIGQELLSEPDVIILDEPTSGLDAMTCLTTVRTLKSIATRHPISIILTIHQPDVDVFNLFDKVYVIAQGGMAIYEGPPAGVAPTLARVNLFMPSDSYNPARFIVENAFVADLEAGADPAGCGAASGGGRGSALAASLSSSSSSAAADEGAGDADADADADDDDDDDDDEAEAEALAGQLEAQANTKHANLIRSSLSSITGALGIGAGAGKQAELAAGKCRDSGRRPLLNIGIQTAEGKLITSDVLQLERQQGQLDEQQAKAKLARLQLLRRLNQLQKEKYYRPADSASASASARAGAPSSGPGLCAGPEAEGGAGSPCSPSSGASGSIYSLASSSYSEARETFVELAQPAGPNRPRLASSESSSQSAGSTCAAADSWPPAADQELADRLQLDRELRRRAAAGRPGPLRWRLFDKRLSAKHGQPGRCGHPVWRHALLLTHRTWLSIVRDPIFFGIQFTMHTAIPVLLALIFGSHQEEGCPQVGNFDLVEFAYQPNQADFIQATMRSIRQSIGNVGVIFFEMFVLSFAINCITALVFPLDMFVLLKEHRNGWYSLRSYFIGRTLADLPVPVALHSMAMSILCYLTGQPLAWWRFAAIISIVILASLVAQSVGLTIGALLMRSSQSAVLAAAGIVAPFFALSGFIVRIHTLPWLARLFANGSYLYHLLNGVIILRYGFGRCPCHEDHFELPDTHKIPANLKTMASLWIGTYSNEFEPDGPGPANRTNVDPNIDIIDKLMGAFKLANSFGHKVEECADVLPYAMLDFNLRDADILWACLSLFIMLIVSRLLTFSAIYYKIRSFS